MPPLTNVHIHVFNQACAPANFLRIIDSRLVRRFPKSLKRIVTTRGIRGLIRAIDRRRAHRHGKARGKFDKYLAFVKVGSYTSQQQVFADALAVGKQFDPDIRLIGLTMDMDHMDNLSRPRKNLNTQLREVKQIKKFYPRHFFPFVGIDPRSKSGPTLRNWCRIFFENGIRSREDGLYYPFFSGLKFYPAQGFFPFDPGLDALYAYAEDQGIPIMSHCTRVGSQYVGTQIESLIPRQPAMIKPEGDEPEIQAAFKKAQGEIEARIERYYRDGKIRNSKIGDNDEACDLFGHPQNYVPVMLKYPRLKICLAHMGGDDQIALMHKPQGAGKAKREALKTIARDGYNWAELTRQLMQEYPQLYTDLSYTLAAIKAPEAKEQNGVREEIEKWAALPDRWGAPLAERILFGTDYYMTEREARERELYEGVQKQLAPYFTAFSSNNPERFLFDLPQN